MNRKWPTFADHLPDTCARDDANYFSAVPSVHTYPISELVRNRSPELLQSLRNLNTCENFIHPNVRTLKGQQKHLIQQTATTVQGPPMHAMKKDDDSKTDTKKDCQARPRVRAISGHKRNAKKAEIDLSSLVLSTMLLSKPAVYPLSLQICL